MVYTTDLKSVEEIRVSSNLTIGTIKCAHTKKVVECIRYEKEKK
jgi:hypothetical protein